MAAGGSQETWADADEFLRCIAKDTGLTVVSVDYRLAPEQPHPAPLVDAFTALLWASEKFASEGILAVGGDSAGGNLAAACAVRAAQERGPQLDLQVLIYPVLDHDFNRPSYETCATAFPLGRADLVYCFDQYVPDEGRRPSPLVSPARLSDPSVLPPALIVVAGHDPLHDEGVAHASRLEEHEVPVTLLDYAELCHGFLRLTGAVEACGTARDEITAQIGQAVSVTARGPRGKTISEAGNEYVVATPTKDSHVGGRADRRGHQRAGEQGRGSLASGEGDARQVRRGTRHPARVPTLPRARKA